MSKQVPSVAQATFDERYITSSEIQKMLEVDRSSILYARKRGILPDPVVVHGVRAFIWERDKVMPYLEAWRISLASRRGELV